MLFRQDDAKQMVHLQGITVESSIMQHRHLQHHPELNFSKNVVLVCKATPLLNITPVCAHKDEAAFIIDAMLMPCCMTTYGTASQECFSTSIQLLRGLRQQITNCCLQEALQQVCNATVHYSSARTFTQTEQPLLEAAVRTLVHVVTPFNAACLRRIYPDAELQLEMQTATKGLQEVIHAWDQEQSQQPGEI